MGLTRRGLSNKLITVQTGTVGGITYTVDGTTLCMCPLINIERKDQYCTLYAGYGTDHPGTGRCKFHGGASGTMGGQITTGRYAFKAKLRFQQQYDAYATDPDMMDLMPELALMRTMLERAIEHHHEMLDKDMYRNKDVDSIVKMADAICRIVDRVDRVQARHTLTVAALRYAMGRAVNVAGEYIDVDTMPEFIKSWRSEVMGEMFGQPKILLEVGDE